MIETTAAVLHGVGDLRIETRLVPPPGPHEVLIRVAACGVCGSDAIEAGRGRVLADPPVTLGHEFAGTIEAVGDAVRDLSVGGVVVSGAGIACGTCRPCRTRRTNLCESYHTIGFHRDGALAGHVVVPASTVYDASHEGLAWDTLALAQPMAIAVHAVRRSGLRAGDKAVVLGVGGIGAFITHVAAALGADVLAVARHQDKIDLARGLGAARGVLSGEAELAAHLAEIGWEPAVFFETSGSAAGLASIVGAAGRGSTIVPVGIQREPSTLSLGAISLNEIAIIGTVAHVFAQDVPEAVRLLAARSDWSDVAGTVLPLSEVADGALAPLLEGRATQTKSIVDPWASAPRPAIHGRVR